MMVALIGAVYRLGILGVHRSTAAPRRASSQAASSTPSSRSRWHMWRRTTGRCSSTSRRRASRCSPTRSERVEHLRDRGGADQLQRADPQLDLVLPGGGSARRPRLRARARVSPRPGPLQGPAHRDPLPILDARRDGVPDVPGPVAAFGRRVNGRLRLRASAGGKRRTRTCVPHAGSRCRHSVHGLFVSESSSSLAVAALDHHVHRLHDEEEHRGGDRDERDQRVQERAVAEDAPVDVNVKAGEIGLADDRGDDRRDEVLATRAVTTAPNAAPMTMPTARSTTLPRSRNALKSLAMPMAEQATDAVGGFRQPGGAGAAGACSPSRGAWRASPCAPWA